MALQLATVRIVKPDGTNFILGQTHFIKSVEDIHEALVGVALGVKFGLAFCEASSKWLVRSPGADAAMIALAEKNALALAAGHCFIVFLGGGLYPVNVLNALKMVPEVCRIFCATANPVETVVAETDQGRGLLGVIDGFSPKGGRGRGGSTVACTARGNGGGHCERSVYVRRDPRHPVGLAGRPLPPARPAMTRYRSRNRVSLAPAAPICDNLAPRFSA